MMVIMTAGKIIMTIKISLIMLMLKTVTIFTLIILYIFHDGKFLL